MKELGVDTSKASMVLIYYDDNGEEVGWDIEDHGNGVPLLETYDSDHEQWNSARPEYLDAETGNYDHSYREECGVFTLQDMIEIMPVTIDKYSLGIYPWRPMIIYHRIGCTVDLENLSGLCIYENPKSSLLDLAFSMLCFLAEKGYLK